MRPEPTVADGMLRRPTVHPGLLTVAEARDAFNASPKTHLLLLVDEGRLIATLTRSDLELEIDPTLPGAPFGTLEDRIVDPGQPLDGVRAAMVHRGQRRLAVVDPSMRLLGLLCLTRRLSGFCTDLGVAQMRRERRRTGG